MEPKSKGLSERLTQRNGDEGVSERERKLVSEEEGVEKFGDGSVPARQVQFESRMEFNAIQFHSFSDHQARIRTFVHSFILPSISPYLFYPLFSFTFLLSIAIFLSHFLFLFRCITHPFLKGKDEEKKG